MLKTLNIHRYLRGIQLGEKIRIEVGGNDPETVILVRRGRQNIRVRREGDEEDNTFLVELNDVLPE
jgi:hypothetical protein